MRDLLVTGFVVTFSLTGLLTACGGRNTDPQQGQTAPGDDRTPTTATLETGANVMQSKAPVEKISMYLNGFHAARNEPDLQMESHHYCDQVNEDFAQCVLYDGNTPDARLHGVEYIVSEKLYETLPPAEKAYWHPHNYEILSGQLRMPGLPDVAEKAALARKINSYGKTWHFWKTGVYGQQPDALPVGGPHLAWSFNRDGEEKPGMIDARDKRMNLNTAEARESRADLRTSARPQGGVDAMRAQFPNASPPPAGVQDNGDKNAHRLPPPH
jgi:hypothetical protein